MIQCLVTAKNEQNRGPVAEVDRSRWVDPHGMVFDDVDRSHWVDPYEMGRMDLEEEEEEKHLDGEEAEGDGGRQGVQEEGRDEMEGPAVKADNKSGDVDKRSGKETEKKAAVEESADQLTKCQESFKYCEKRLAEGM